MNKMQEQNSILQQRTEARQDYIYTQGLITNKTQVGLKNGGKKRTKTRNKNTRDRAGQVTTK